MILFSSEHVLSDIFMYQNKILKAKRFRNTAWIPDSCESCLATKAALKIKKSNFNGPNATFSPGEEACRSLRDTQHTNFYTEAGEIGFCIFPDNSYISSFGLYQFALKNNRK